MAKVLCLRDLGLRKACGRARRSAKPRCSPAPKRGTRGAPTPPSISGTPSRFRAAITQLEEYFAGERREFDLPLAAEGTDFQREVWRGLATIPYGVTRSYSQFAEAIGRPRAVRAVGLANGRNPISVIGADGTPHRLRRRHGTKALPPRPRARRDPRDLRPRVENMVDRLGGYGVLD